MKDIKLTRDQILTLASIAIALFTALPLINSYISRIPITDFKDSINITIWLISQNKFLLIPIFLSLLIITIFIFKIEIYKYARYLIILIVLNIIFTSKLLKSDTFVYSTYDYIIQLEHSKNVDEAYKYCLVANSLNRNKLNMTKRRLANKREVINSLKSQLDNCSPSIHGNACYELEIMLKALSNE